MVCERGFDACACESIATNLWTRPSLICLCVLSVCMHVYLCINLCVCVCVCVYVCVCNLIWSLL